jgi:hypothetical protein
MNKFCELLDAYLKNRLNEFDFKLDGQFVFGDEQIYVFYSEKLKKNLLLVSLEKKYQIKDLEEIRNYFENNYKKKEGNIAFALRTFQCKFIFYDFNISNKI